MDSNKDIDADYISAISELSSSKSNKAILTSSYQQAKLLIELMFEAANEDDSIYIYSYSLRKKAFKDGILKARAKSITVLIDDDAEIQWTNELPQVIRNTLSIYKIKIAHIHNKYFFFTSSGAYRFEPDSHSSIAAANFFDPKTVDKLFKSFTVLLVDAENISNLIK